VFWNVVSMTQLLTDSSGIGDFVTWVCISLIVQTNIQQLNKGGSFVFGTNICNNKDVCSVIAYEIAATLKMLMFSNVVSVTKLLTDSSSK